jgi:hypothetical protein
MNPKSLGFIGAAIHFTKTCPGPGFSTGTFITLTTPSLGQQILHYYSGIDSIYNSN